MSFLTTEGTEFTEIAQRIITVRMGLPTESDCGLSVKPLCAYSVFSMFSVFKDASAWMTLSNH
jgi:hypothetical protein